MPNGINTLIAQGGGRLPGPIDLQGIQRNALVNQGMRQQLEAYPEERNWLRQQRQMETEKFGMAKEDWVRKKEMQPMQDEAEALKYLMTVAPMITYQSYPQSRQWLIEKNKINPALLPDPQAFEQQAAQTGENPEALFENWKLQSTTTGKQRLDAMMKQQESQAKERPYKVGQEITRDEKGGKGTYRITGYDKNGFPMLEKVAMGEKEESKTDLEKTIEKYNSLPEGNEKQFYLARINKLTQSTGMKVTVDKDGNVTLMQGAMGKEGFEGLSKKVQGQVEEKLLAGKEQLARLQAINEEFKPEYLETGMRLKAAWTGIKARLGQNVSKEDASSLIEFKKFQRKSIENINLYIKEITGAQMSEKEADRIRLAQPDPGEKWYQGDDPITFKAKLDDSIKMTRAAVARFDYYKNKGLSDQEIKGLINSDKAIPLATIAGRM